MSKVPIDIDACAASLIARIAAAQDAAEARAVRLRAQARDAARVLVSEFSVSSVWLFGSLAWGSPHEASDVDLLVDGLDSHVGGAAERRVASIIEGSFDLVRLEEAHPSLVERVLREGVRIDDTP